MDKWIYISAFFSSLIIFLIRSYYKYKLSYFIILTIFAQWFLLYSYCQIFKDDNIVSQYFMVKILAGLLLFIPSIYLFENSITITKLIGVILGIIAIFLLA